MSATRCTCLMDVHYTRLVIDPTCAATLIHQLHHDTKEPAR